MLTKQQIFWLFWMCHITCNFVKTLYFAFILRGRVTIRHQVLAVCLYLQFLGSEQLNNVRCELGNVNCCYVYKKLGIFYPRVQNVFDIASRLVNDGDRCLTP